MSKTCGETIIDYLVKEKVEYVLGIPGHGCLSIFDALRKRVEEKKIKYIQVMQEMDAVYIADGYYRATGKPLAILTSIGPGAINTIIGLATAFVDSVAALLIMGDTHTNMRGVGVLQEIERNADSDNLSCFKPVTKRCWRVENEHQVPKIMQRAFNLMTTGRPGPVAISVPMDIQAKAIDNDDFYEPELHKTEAKMYGDLGKIDSAVKIMKTAKRPVIVAGGGVLHSFAFEELKRLSEYWGAAVVTTMASKSCFPENHKLYGFHGGSKGTDVGNYLCKTSDVVLAVGCRFADETTSSYRKGITYNFPDTKLIQIDIDSGEIGKNYPCDVGILGDASIVMTQLLSELKKEDCKFERDSYFKDIENAKINWFNKLNKIIEDGKDKLTISGFYKTFQEIYPKDGYIVTSSGNTQAQMLQEYRFETPGTCITTGGFSTMGYAFPAGIGVKLAKPERPVAVFVGDGDFLMAVQELSIIAQQNTKMLVIVFNNCGWMAIRDLQLDVFGKGYDFGCKFVDTKNNPYSPNFCEVAKAFGVRSMLIENNEDIKTVVGEALKVDGPVLLEVKVTMEYPYSGGNATGWWDVPIPAYMQDKRKEYLKNITEEFY